MATRFVVNVNRAPKTVFKVHETRSGDLNVHTTSGGRRYSGKSLQEMVETQPESAFEECNTHISVHNTPSNPQLNFITQTEKFADRQTKMAQATTGIKVENLFVPVLFRVSGDHSRPRYDLPANCKDRLISLGQYEPRVGQLRFMIVCSRRDKNFPFHAEHPSNNLEVQFRCFNLTLLWSYLNQPSHPQAIDFFLGTSKESGPMRGADWFEIYNLYTDLSMLHANEYFRAYGDGH